MNFKNPPIREATIDVRVVLPDSVPSPKDLMDFASTIEGYSQDVKQLLMKQVIIQGSPEGESVEHKNTPSGVVIQSVDKQYLVKVLPDGIAVIRLGNYISGDELYQAFMRVWPQYIKRFAPRGFTRFGMRFINDFVLPVPTTEHKTYIAISPDTGNFSFDGFGVGMGMKSPDKLSQANVYVEVSPADDNKSKALIDIDVFQIFETSKEITDQNLKQAFDMLRVFKNNIFKEVVTEDARKLFN